MSEREAEGALRLLDSKLQEELGASDGEVDREPESVALPESWGETLTGEPMPDVVAAVRRSREAH